MKSIVPATVLLAALATCAPAMAQGVEGLLINGFVALRFPEPTQLSGVYFRSESQHLVPIPPGTMSAPADPFAFLIANNSSDVSFSEIPSTTIELQGTWVTDVGYSGPRNEFCSDMMARYGGPFFSVSIPFLCVPEPSSNAIATIGALALLTLRRRRTP